MECLVRVLGSENARKGKGGAGDWRRELGPGCAGIRKGGLGGMVVWGAGRRKGCEVRGGTCGRSGGDVAGMGFDKTGAG